MRRALYGLAASSVALILVGTGSGVAGERAGQVVRVEAPPRREVFVPAGTFVMGVDEDEAAAARAQCQLAYYPPNAIPRLQGPGGPILDFCNEYYVELSLMAPREVFLDAYAIDRYEVSVADYRRCVAAGGCALDALVEGDVRYLADDGAMANVTWDEAATYCRWRGARLPTEAEWERAARGDRVGADWPWGEAEQLSDFNHGQPRAVSLREIERRPFPVPVRFFGDPDDSDGHRYIAPPGSYPWGESPFGTRDQAGNVAEWTADAYYREDRLRGYANLPTMNPVREGSAMQPRVVRGGSWRQPPFVAKSHLRDPFNVVYDATERYSHIGFRCARSLR
jgi:sulfatase modifying factor 1